MARPSPYSDEDRAKVAMSLAISGGNVKRASRETNVPEQTVRNWKKKWDDEGGPPPEVSDVVETKIAPQFVETATRVRDAALAKIEELIPETDVKDLARLVTVFGTADDKIRLALGLATSRKEVTHSLPSPEEMRELAQSFAQGAVEAALNRDADIIDVTVEEQAELPALHSPLHD